MAITLNTIKNNLASFIAVGIMFSGGWYYLDQQRMEAVKEKEEALKIKIQAELKKEELEKQEQKIAETKKRLQRALDQQARDKELSELTLKFVNEYAGIDFHKQCGDNSKHNAKARKAIALLQLIEAKASEYGRTEIIDNFTEKQDFGIRSWSANCDS